MIPSKLQDLVKDYNITLNGVSAEIYQTADGILVSNNDFSSPDLQYSELHLEYPKFKKELLKNNGKFKV